MSDLFISYSRHDQTRVDVLAAELERAGWSVWWDRHIKSGNSFDKLIEDEIRKARAVVVVWSHESVNSDWVRAEAAFAQEQSKLVPVRLDASPAPLRFLHVQAVELSGWSGRAGDTAALQRLFDDLSALIGTPEGGRPVASTPAPGPKQPVAPPLTPSAGSMRSARNAAVAVCALIAAAVTLGLWWRQSPLPASPAAPTAAATSLTSTSTSAPLPDTAAAAESAPPLEPLDQDMVALRDVPLRAAPDPTSAQLGQLKNGTPVHVAGRVRGRDWYAVQRTEEPALAYVVHTALGERAVRTAAIATRKEAAPPPSVAAPLAIATATPAAPAIEAATVAVPAVATANRFDGSWKGQIRCRPTRNLPAVAVEGNVITVTHGEVSGQIPLPGAAAAAEGEYRGHVEADGALLLNGQVKNSRRGDYALTLRGRIDGNSMRATGLVLNRQCMLDYTRQ